MSKIFKFLTKLSLIILLVVGVSGVIALWSVGLFIPHAVENAFNENTSFDLKIRSSKVKLWRGLVSFENAFITNPSRFVSHELTHIKKLKVDAAMTLGLLLHRDLSHLILRLAYASASGVSTNSFTPCSISVFEFTFSNLAIF